MRTTAITLLLGGIAAVFVHGLTGAGAMAGQTPPTGIAITHIAVAVHDVERSARAYADLVGITVPPVEVERHRQGVGPVKRATLRLGNVVIELLEPAEDGTPLAELLTRRGQGVHHVGLSTQEQGPTDLFDHLGLVLHGDADHDAVPSPEPVSGPPLAHPTCITHLGIVVRDITRARQVLADAIGVEGTPIRQFEEAKGLAQYTAFNLDNVSIELLAQAGDGTGSYAEFLEAGGPRAHHFGIHLRREGDSFGMQDQIAWLEEHDGLMAVNAGGFAYVDLRPQLGLHIEALSPEASDRVYPHPHPVP